MHNRIPDFFVAGHPKCGTTALYAMLGHHPDIYMPDVKEPGFFSDDLRPRFEPPGGGREVISLDEYAGLFAHAGPEQLTGDSSPWYLRSHNAAQHIAALQPQAKIIVVLREPVSFLRSLHLQWLQSHTETVKDLRRALALEPRRLRGECIPRSSYRPQSLIYSEWVRYVSQLKRLHEAFSREQVMVLIYEEYRRDNEATLHAVMEFLDVDVQPIVPVKANPSVYLRSRHLDAAMHAVTLGKGSTGHFVQTAIKKAVPSTVRKGAIRILRERIIYGKPPAADGELLEELRSRLKPEVERLSAYLDRDFVKAWHYDRI